MQQQHLPCKRRLISFEFFGWHHWFLGEDLSTMWRLFGGHFGCMLSLKSWKSTVQDIPLGEVLGGYVRMGSSSSCKRSRFEMCTSLKNYWKTNSKAEEQQKVWCIWWLFKEGFDLCFFFPIRVIIIWVSDKIRYEQSRIERVVGLPSLQNLKGPTLKRYPKRYLQEGLYKVPPLQNR